jgi:hypothetical protein
VWSANFCREIGQYLCPACTTPGTTQDIIQDVREVEKNCRDPSSPWKDPISADLTLFQAPLLRPSSPNPALKYWRAPAESRYPCCIHSSCTRSLSVGRQSLSTRGFVRSSHSRLRLGRLPPRVGAKNASFSTMHNLQPSGAGSYPR